MHFLVHIERIFASVAADVISTGNYFVVISEAQKKKGIHVKSQCVKSLKIQQGKYKL